MVDTLQQRDLLHLLTGGGRALEEVVVHNTEQSAAQATPEAEQSPAQKPSQAEQSATQKTSQKVSQFSATTQERATQEPFRLYFLLMGMIRIPILLLLGIITPLALFLWNWNSVIYSETLKPYLMLLGAQAGSLIVGISLLGEGVVPFIGCIYSVLRVCQIDGLLDLRFRASSQLPKALQVVLRAALVLWALNAIILLLHILAVTWRLLHPG